MTNKALKKLADIINTYKNELPPGFVQEIKDWKSEHIRVLSASDLLSDMHTARLSPSEIKQVVTSNLIKSMANELVGQAEITQTNTLNGMVYRANVYVLSEDDHKKIESTTFDNFGSTEGKPWDHNSKPFTFGMLEKAYYNLTNNYQKIEFNGQEWVVIGRRLKVFQMYYDFNDFVKIRLEADKELYVYQIAKEFQDLYRVDEQTMREIDACVETYFDDYRKWVLEMEKLDSEDIT